MPVYPDTAQCTCEMHEVPYPDSIAKCPQHAPKEEKAICQICGNPMPKGEEMFNYHGYSCDCPPKNQWKTTPKEQSQKIKDLVERMDYRLNQVKHDRKVRNDLLTRLEKEVKEKAFNESENMGNGFTRTKPTVVLLADILALLEKEKKGI